MAYLGNVPARSFISFEKQVFTIVNSQTAYTLSHSVTNENDIRLVINNVVQEPGSGKAYTASGTTLTLSAALTNGTDEMYCVFLGRAVGTVDPPAGSVSTTELASDAVTTAKITDLNVTTAKIAADAITEAKIADDAVESEHLNDNVISGQTELASTPDDTDEFLVSDAGTIKRIDYSLIKGGGITQADQYRLSADQYNDTNPLSSNIERVDTDGFGKIGTGISVSSGTFSFPETGIYLIDAVALAYTGQNNALTLHIMTTTDNSTYDEASRAMALHVGSGYAWTSVNCKFMFDVTDTSTHKVQFKTSGTGGGAIFGATNANRSHFTFIRLGDT